MGVARSYSWAPETEYYYYKPEMATNLIIHDKMQNLYKIAQFMDEKSQILLYLKFSDNLKLQCRLNKIM